MRISTNNIPYLRYPEVGNVYPVYSGEGRRCGYLQVVIAVTPTKRCVLITVDMDGLPVSATSYHVDYIATKPIVGFVPGLDELQFDMEPING